MSSKPELKKLIRKKTLASTLVFLVSIISILIILFSMFFFQQLKNRHKDDVNLFIHDLQSSIRTLETQVESIASNDLIINSLIDQDNKKDYLPLFFRSLQLTIKDKVAIAFTDFSGSLILGKNSKDFMDNQKNFIWKDKVLNKSQSFSEFNDTGVFIAYPVLYANQAEGAIAVHINSLQSAVISKKTKGTIILIGSNNAILYSNDPKQFPINTVIPNNTCKIQYCYQIPFDGFSIVSTEPYLSAYKELYWLFIYLIVALLSSTFGVIYAIRRSASLASSAVSKMQDRISNIVNTPDKLTEINEPDNEPKEFEALRIAFNALISNVLNTTISINKIEGIINSLGELLFVVNYDGRVILKNNSMDLFIKQTGKKVNFRLSEVISDDIINCTTTDVLVVTKSYTISNHYSSNEADSEILIKWTRRPYYNEKNEVYGHILVGRNITSERALLSELRIKNQAIDEAQLSIILCDATQNDNPIIYVNQAFTNLTGYSFSEAMGRNCRFLQGEDTDSKTLDAMRKSMDNEKALNITILNYKKDGTPFYNDLSVSPIFDDQRNLTHYIGFQSDVTVREDTTRYLETAKRSAEESAQLKSEFLASMSHEIRTPMNGVLGMLRILLRKSLTSDQEKYAKIALSSAESLLTIINDILDFSKT